MQMHNWLLIGAVIIIGYIIGVKMPQYGQKLGL